MLFSVSVMQAQNRTVKGTVTDVQGEPIIGANVVIVGGTKGVITDLDGKYSIQVPENGAVLKFSYIGFKTKSYNVAKGKSVLDVTLEEDAVMLEQTVVTAMDLRRDEKSLSTAFQKMDVTSMTENRDAGFVNMLQGKVAGLQVISNGAAGSATVRIRGANSISGNNQPLYVIDGVPIINNVKDGQVILMHDLHPTTAQAMVKAIPKLHEMGYQLVTIDEMAKVKGGYENVPGYVKATVK